MFGVGEGPSSQENQQYANLTSAGSFATGTGESDLTASSKFMHAILSGDSTAISQAFAPQIGAAKTSAQQNAKTTSEFGNRGGGTNASSAAASDKAHSDITSLIGGGTSSAATSLGSEGSGLLGMGIGADTSAFDEAKQIQSQKAAKWDDIFKSAVAVGAAPFTGGASLTALGSGGSSPG